MSQRFDDYEHLLRLAAVFAFGAQRRHRRLRRDLPGRQGQDVLRASMIRCGVWLYRCARHYACSARLKPGCTGPERIIR